MFCRSLRARSRVAFVERAGGNGIHIRQHSAEGWLIGGIEAHPPERRVRGIHDEATQPILGISRGCVRADQVFAALRHFGFGLQKVERRRLADIDARLILPRKLLRKLERALLQCDVGERRLERPIRLLHCGRRLDDRLSNPQLGAFEIAPRDDRLLAREIHLAIFQQRLRHRQLEAGLQSGIEARQRIVGRLARRVPRQVPAARAPGQPLLDPR